MKILRNLIVLALFAFAAAGCSDDDEGSSVKLVYNRQLHAGKYVSIRPLGTQSDIFERQLKAGFSELVIPLNAGNYEINILSSKIAFQVRENHQLRIDYTDASQFVVGN